MIFQSKSVQGYFPTENLKDGNSSLTADATLHKGMNVVVLRWRSVLMQNMEAHASRLAVRTIVGECDHV